MAFYQIDPFGEERADLRAAMIQATSVNKWIPANKKPVSVEEFLPKFHSHVDPTPKEVWGKIDAAMFALGGQHA